MSLLRSVAITLLTVFVVPFLLLYVFIFGTLDREAQE